MGKVSLQFVKVFCYFTFVFSLLFKNIYFYLCTMFRHGHLHKADPMGLLSRVNNECIIMTYLCAIGVLESL